MISKKYEEALLKKAKLVIPFRALARANPALCDVDIRLLVSTDIRMLEVLVPTIALSKAFASPVDSIDLAKINNDEIAEIVTKHPDKFMAGVALLPLNDVNAAVKEAERVGDIALR